MSTVISRLLEIFGFGGKQPSLRERIDQIIVQLDDIADRVAEIEFRFKKRSQELFERVITLIKRGEKSRAAIYAGEVSQIRNVLKMVIAIRNLIVMTKERLVTVKDLRELSQSLMVFGAALESIKGEVEALHPNLTILFDEITRKVKNMIVETAIDANVNIDPAIVTNDALQVLNEAIKLAEESVKESFPVPPVDNVVQFEARKKAAAAVPVGYGGSAPHPRAERLEELVLSYIREHNGYLDIRDFTSRYNVSKEEVLRTLYRLVEKGLIKLS